MAQVFCGFYNCINNKGGLCDREQIFIGDYSNIYDEPPCSSYSSYLDTPEYQTEYYIAVKMEKGKRGKATKCGKAIKKGKQIEYNGYTFFTSDKTNDDDDFEVTEKRTGYQCGIFKKLKDNWELFLKTQSIVPNVEDYPLCEYNEKSRQYEPKEGVNNGGK